MIDDGLHNGYSSCIEGSASDSDKTATTYSSTLVLRPLTAVQIAFFFEASWELDLKTWQHQPVQGQTFRANLPIKGFSGIQCRDDRRQTFDSLVGTVKKRDIT